MEFLTVNKLRDALSKLIDEGKGDRIILVPDYDTDFPNDYRTVSVVADDDMTNQCIYLEYNDDEEELNFWDEREVKSNAI